MLACVSEGESPKKSGGKGGQIALRRGQSPERRCLQESHCAVSNASEVIRSEQWPAQEAER